MKITGPIMVWAVISAFVLLHASDSGLYVFFSPFCSSWERDSLKWRINQTFRWLVSCSAYKPPGQVLFDYSAVMWGLQPGGAVTSPVC